MNPDHSLAEDHSLVCQSAGCVDGDRDRDGRCRRSLDLVPKKADHSAFVHSDDLRHAGHFRGTFMAVLIAIEIFINITVYLRDDVIHVKIVLATALMAIARKVIILDLETVTAEQIVAIGVVVSP